MSFSDTLSEPAPRLSVALSVAVLVMSVVVPAPTLGRVSSTTPQTAARLTLDRLYSLPNLIGTAPRGFAWSADGRHLAFLWNDEGRGFHDVWMLDVEDPDGAPERVTRMPHAGAPATESDNPVAAVEADIRVERDRGVSSVVWHPDGRQMLVSFRGDLWLVAMHAEPRRLTETRAAEMQAAYSPDGDILAFLREGDLWLMVAAGPASAAVRRTNIAGPDIRLAGFQWSSDGSRIAVLETDQREVTLRGIPDYLSEETRLVSVRRAYPGEESGGQRIGVVDATLAGTRGGGVEWIEMGAGPSEGGRPDMLLSYRWSPDGSRLAIDTSDLFAKDRRIFVADFDRDVAPAVRLLVREQEPLNETFYYWRIEWSADSRLLYFLSDRDEDYHVWAVAPTDPAPRPVRLTASPA